LIYKDHTLSLDERLANFDAEVDILKLKWVVVQEQISGTFLHVKCWGESYFDGAPPAATAYSLKIEEDENVIWTYSASDDYGDDERKASGHATCSGG